MSQCQYDFYLDGMLLPVAPSELKIAINNQNETYVLIDQGEINLLKRAGLTDIEFECLLPQVRYPFAVYAGGFQPAVYYLQKLEQLKVGCKPFQFIVSRTLPSGKVLFSNNIKVSLEDYTVTERAANGFDLMVKIRLKQYRDYGTKVYELKEDKATGQATASVKNERPASTVAENVPSSGLPKAHTVQRGDTLWGLAQHYYGDGSLYGKIANANGIANPNYIVDGAVLTIPAV